MDRDTTASPPPPTMRRSAAVWVAFGGALAGLLVGVLGTAFAYQFQLIDARQELSAAERSAAAAAAQPLPAVTVTVTPEPTDLASSGLSATAPPSPTVTPTAAAWEAFPWPAAAASGACPRPAAPTGSAAAGIPVVVLGDSLIRDSLDVVRTSLQKAGFAPVFVCANGKTTEWGIEQVKTMRRLHLLPDCLVVNLGTNDVKNDDVTPDELRSRVGALATQVSEIATPIVVDIWADAARAPRTMRDIADQRAAFDSAVSGAGGVFLAPWADAAIADPALIGSDGVHDSAAGKKARAALVTNQASALCS